jgi:benzoyl-CoA reductase/2-hydroxyglutaryl-CoA dehydratase subunit BcrC/BadD/HgdB
MKRVGLTSTVPVEVIYAAGWTPIDLNNVFITSNDPQEMVSSAEKEGYPRNACGWIKGIYTAAMRSDLDAVIAVVEGDCSQTHAMTETWQMAGMRIIPFSYPYSRNAAELKNSIEKLMVELGTDWDKVNAWKARLDSIRSKVWKLDDLTWRDLSYSSEQNHYFQVCCSDFNSDPDAFEHEVDTALNNPTPGKANIRLGFIGVPPIFSDLYGFIDNHGARIVFNEVQRQFTMPFETDDIVQQYLRYTYPYDIFCRVEDINREIERRQIDGIIHYTQSFCFRQIEDIIVRKQVNVPILTIEGDSPCSLDARTSLRIESFLEMLDWKTAKK